MTVSATLALPLGKVFLDSKTKLAAMKILVFPRLSVSTLLKHRPRAQDRAGP